jgi:radical SAM superfamily enzyme YgiQ (UPF0313 family)
MKYQRIVFVEPRADHLNIFSRYNLPRLGCTLLATILKEKGYDASVLFVHEKEVYKMNPACDLAAISTITPTAPQAYRLADWFRSRGVPTVMGGPHVSFLPEEALTHADYCVLGEGEESMPMLLEALNGERTLASVPNLAYRENGAVVRTGRKPFTAPLDSLPFPDFSLVDYGANARLKRAFLKTIVPIQTSRGCPYDCTFCSVTGMFGKRYRFRSTESVLAELGRYNPKKHKIFFYDDNFAANRRRTKELLQAMIDRGLQFTWSTQVRAEIAKDPELLDLLHRAGCTTVYIGFESVDPAALELMKKSQTIEEIRAAIKAFHAHRIFIHGMFVFGFDTDTKASIRSTIRFAIKENIDSAQFMILTPLPGSDFYVEARDGNRIFTYDWNKYDAHHVTFTPRHLSLLRLQFLQIEAHTRFYSPLQVVKKLFRNNVAAFIIGMYAHNLNQKWLRLERKYLASLKDLANQALERARNTARSARPAQTDRA